jgi:branched-subunit amino acid aminotransferase/4-amino-4-deoxychorismate lyase
MTVWVWNSGEHRFEEPLDDVGAWSLLAADSWFVKDGRVRAFERHQARFADAAEQVSVGGLVTAELWAAVIEKIPEAGEWFPRADVLESDSGVGRVVAFRLRPAPTRTCELRVLVPAYSDPRQTPGRKGPDIALLERLRTQAREDCDCGEVLLFSEDGYVVEGATTSLLWWDGDVLCLPDPELGALPGVTSAVVLEEALAKSIPVEYRRVRPEGLIGYEVWLVNALHGIRRVKEFVAERSESPRSHKQREADGNRERWQQWLESQRRPIVLPGDKLYCPDSGCHP